MLPVLPVVGGLVGGGFAPLFGLMGFGFGCGLAAAVGRRDGKWLADSESLTEDVNDGQPYAAANKKIDDNLDRLRTVAFGSEQISGVRFGPTRYVPCAGDHIRVRCWFGPVPYHHHGIAGWDHQTNRPTAIHYDSGMDEGGIKRRKQAAAVRETSLDRFAGSAGRDAIELVERPHDAQTVLTRAYSALGSELWAEGTYDLLSNNCEHFARWCVGGWGYSQQVARFSILRSGISATVSEFARRLWSGTIRRIAVKLGLGSLIPGIGWLLLGAGIVYAGYELAKGLGVFCNGHRTEIDGTAVRRAAFAYGVRFP
jgi:hypothetical protein